MFSNFIMLNLVPICKGIILLLGTCVPINMRREGGSALGRRLPKGTLEEKETRGDKGREGTLKNQNLGRRLLWMVPK